MNKFQKGGGSRDSWKGKSSGGYNKSSKFGGNSGGSRFGGGNSRGRDDRDERPEMHKATCAECGDRCEVPFRPNGKRPVLCSNCYKQDSGPRDFGAQRHTSTFHDRDDRRDDRGGDRYPTPRPRVEAAGVSPELAAQLKEINEKLDVLIEVLTMDEADMDDEMEDDEEGIEVAGEDNQA